MNLDMVNEVIDSFSKWAILRDLSLLENTKEVTIPKIIENIGVNRTNPYFYQILGVLIDIGVVKEVKVFGKMKLLNIYTNKIIKLAKDCDFFQDNIAEYIRKTSILYSF